ncbi:toll-interacting protein-like [Convolutriloba macropyga]|uniref:toll-interacting protein-like n=1 Tax=Convolutriloba macropyga TaxID=536237 RepID=UPI003F520C72
MDPYCKITIESRVFETATCYSASTKPIWNKALRCPSNTKVNNFLVEIMDENQFYADSRIAYCNVNLSQEMLRSQDTHTLSLPLSGSQGEGKEGTLFLQVRVQDVEALQNDMAAQFQLAALTDEPALNSQSSESQAQSGGDSSLEQNVEAAVYEPTEEDIKQIVEMFPTVEEQVVKSVLEANDGNMINSINSMLALTVQDQVSQDSNVNGVVDA